MAEKGDGVDTVSLPPTYAPSEAYTESPPPAYKRAKSTTVQVARMVCITLLAVAFMVGFFTLTSNYISAKQCDCHNDGHKHDHLHSASVLPQVEKLVGEEGLNKVEEMNGNELESPEEPVITKDVLQQDLQEEPVPDAMEEDDGIISDEVKALIEEVPEIEEAEREIEEELAVQDIMQKEIDEMKKKIKLPIDLILGNPSLAGRDVNCEVERRQQPIGGGIVTQAIIVTCSDDDDNRNNNPGILLSPPAPRPFGPPLSLLAPIMKMLSSRAKARVIKPIQIKTMAGPPPFALQSGPRPCSPNGPFPCFINQPKNLGPFPGPMNGPFPMPGPINGPIHLNGPMPGPLSGPFPGSDGPFPGSNGPFPGSNGPFPGSNGPFPGSNGPFPGSNGPFPGSNGPFPDSNGPFPGSNGPFPGSDGPFPSSNGRSLSPNDFPIMSGPFPGPFPGPNPEQISRHLHVPVNGPSPNDLLGPFPSDGPAPSGPKILMQSPIITETFMDNEPRHRMLPIALRPLPRVSPRMPKFLAFTKNPENQGLQTLISSLQRGANKVPQSEPKILPAFPEPQGRALPAPVSLPSLRLLPARLLSGPVFMRGIRRNDEPRPITHMEMRKPEPSPNVPDFEPRFPDFGPPRVHTVISPQRPGPVFDQFPPNAPPKIGELDPSKIVSKIIEINHPHLPEDIMAPPKPIAVIHKTEPIAGHQIPLFPPPPPPPPSMVKIPPPPSMVKMPPPPPPPHMDPEGRIGNVHDVEPEAEFVVHSEQPPTPAAFVDAIPKEIHERAPQSAEDRKHHLLIVN
ncbi:basic proline-rich protein-like [Palaemon carinicauda]|uniref:basic proline-rich protein-like n=1 Tax=Palaemon carinicauda TaxID=392227 RepID=UPI0035B658CA